MDTIKLAVEELERLGNGGEPAREDCGACWNVANACKDEDFPGSPEWNRAASAWRGFSGLYSAPIPHHWGGDQGLLERPSKMVRQVWPAAPRILPAHGKGIEEAAMTDTYAQLVAILTRLKQAHGIKAFSLPEHQATMKAIETLKNKNGGYTPK